MSRRRGGAAVPSGMLIEATIWATLAAGTVAALRQRREAAEVRRGDLPPLRPDDPDAGGQPRGRLAAAVGSWVPAPPETPVGRVVATAWSAPLTIGGLVIGTLARARPRWDPDHGCLVFEGATGLPAAALRAVGAGANAIGQTVVSTYDPTPALLLAHEAGHVRQAERLGPLLLPLYAWFGARYGYRANPIERGARAAARAWRSDRT